MPRNLKETTFFIYKSSTRAFSTCCCGSTSSRDRTPGEGTDPSAEVSSEHPTEHSSHDPTRGSPQLRLLGELGDSTEHGLQEGSTLPVPALCQELLITSPHPPGLRNLMAPVCQARQTRAALFPGWNGGAAFPGNCFYSCHSLQTGPGLQGFPQIQGFRMFPSL